MLQRIARFPISTLLILLCAGLPAQDGAALGLSRDAADRLAADLYTVWAARERPLREEELNSGVITCGTDQMRIWFQSIGEAPQDGRALYISLHGGGSAPAEVNDQQWQNQQKLYAPKDCIYVAPRAPTDSWNMWHQAPLDALLDRLIQDMVLARGVNPDRVCIMGYSAGGDGVYQLAPRMADRFAAAAMMAGHPNETRPDGLRNLPFTLHMGAEDSAFKRNEVARTWKEQLAKLRAADPDGYPHFVKLHAGMGHWMQRKDAEAVPWMESRRRRTRPQRVVWLQDDVVHPRFYWLATSAPKAGARCVAQISGQCIDIEECSGFTDLRIRLDDLMCDLDQPVTLRWQGQVLCEQRVPRQRGIIEATLRERGDARGIYCAEISVPLPAQPPR